ncbi:MAG TPA: hypothetical protein VGS62_06385 [Streptosporangiaceae bacterium]|nr:hypothetical protein [Streptosporangiaceae bacterium]
MAQQGSGPPRYPATPQPADTDPFEDSGELPVWAGPSPIAMRRPARPARPHGGPSRPRAHAGHARRSRQRTYFWAAVAAVAAVIVLLVILLPGGSARTGAGNNGFVSSFQPGEYRTVPSVCGAVSAATLRQYLAGRRARVAPQSLSGAAESQCDWTLDHRPVYRLLDVTAQAYAPSGLASGNGSATAAATDAYGQAMQGLAHPPRATHQPSAQITAIPRLGTAAFSAFQAIPAGGDITDRVTVVVRLRNVLVTVQFSGLAHSARGRYGPVSAATLDAGALAAAKDVLGKIG